MLFLPPPGSATDAIAGTLPAGFEEAIALGGLTQPTAVRFAADGRVFVAEKSGLVKVFDGLDDSTPDVFADLRTNVHNYWDRGLLGLALHPQFPAMPYVYVLYTLDAALGGAPPRWGQPDVSEDPCPSPPGPLDSGCVVAGRLSRLEAVGNATIGAEQVLLEDWCQQYPSHSVGALVFGPDGALYVGAGDGASFMFPDYGQGGTPPNPCGDPPGGATGVPSPPLAEGGALRSQDIRTAGDALGFNGAVLRIDPLTGAALADNPLVGGPRADDDRVVAFGLRNPYRLATRPGTGELWIGDVGWNTWEEVDRLLRDPTRAVNFGWPCYEGVGRQPSYEATGLALCDTLYADPDAVTPPYYAYQHNEPIVPDEACGTGSSSISGLAFYGAGTYPPAYAGALFFADFSRSCIWAMLAAAGGDPDPRSIRTLVAGAASPVDLTVGPDGDLYYVDFYGGTVRRIRYTATGQAPLARIAADTTSGPVPLVVHFDGRSSSDPDGDELSYAWDLDGDGELDDATDASPTYTYAEPRSVVVRLRVTDVHGATNTTTLPVTAADPLPPTAREDFHVPGTQLGDVGPDVISTSASCVACHGRYAPESDPYDTWAGSLMAHAGRDPLFRAQMATANQDVPGVGYFCMRCHVPMSVVTGHIRQTDGRTLDATDLDGIGCHFCHALVDPKYRAGVSPLDDAAVLASLGEVPTTYGNAMFVLDPAGVRRGPYSDPLTEHEWLHAPFITSSDICGTCHDVGNPAVSRASDDGGYRANASGVRAPSDDPHQQFPLERTYSEWRLSSFARGGVDLGGRFGGDGADVVATCQDCHMPRTTAAGCAYAPPRADLARHDFAGAAAPILDLIAAYYASDPTVDQAALARGRAKSIAMLERAASLALRQNGASLQVRLINETGHKLPTGHIEGRRVWLHVAFTDDTGTRLDEYGRYDDATGEIGHDTTVYEMRVGLSDAAAQATGLSAGPTTHMALADTIVKDNRIPPRGFENAAFAAAGASVVGASYADGQHWDEPVFPIPPAATAVTVTAYYQNLPREYVEALRTGNVSDHWGSTLHDLWNATGRGTPIPMISESLALAPRDCPGGCDDTNLCTDDACVAGHCEHAANTTPCDDGVLCTSDDRCSDGTCGRGTPQDARCDDGNVCTIDHCDASTEDGCTHVAADDTTITDTWLALRRLRAPGAGTFTLHAIVVRPGQLAAALDPLHDGLAIELVSTTGAAVERLVIPGASYDPKTRSGWKASRSGRWWQYRDRTRAVAASLRTLTTPQGGVAVEVRARRQTYALPSTLGRMELRIRVGASANDCAATGFADGAVDGPSCRFARGASVVVCR